MNEIVFIKKEQALTSSRKVAEVYGRRHANLLRDIRNLLEKNYNPAFNRKNFILSAYKDSQGKIQPEYILTRDGFSLLAMTFTGIKSLPFKDLFIKAFNEAEESLRKENL